MRSRRVKPIIIRKQAFFPWIAGLVLIIVTGLMAARIIKLAQMPDYAKRQQFFQHRVEKNLDRILGRSHYVVNVGVQLAESKREVSRVLYTPRNVTEIFEQTVKGPDTDYDEPVQSKPAPPIAKKTDLTAAEAIERLPGLAPRSSKMATGGVPGFPRVRALAGAKNTTRTLDPLPLAQAQQRGEIRNDQIYIKQYFNENKETISFPETKIDRLSISVILDKSRLKELNISAEDVAIVIRSTVGFVSERGDTFKVVTYPFKGWRHGLYVTGHATGALWNKGGDWVISLTLLSFIVWLLMTATRSMIKQKKQKYVNRQQTLNRVSHVHQKRIDYQTQSQLEELISLSRSHPQDFITAVQRWITVSEEST